MFLLLVALFALVLLISSTVAASSDKKNQNMEANSVEDAKYGRPGYGNPGRGGGGYPRKGCRYGCCRGYRHGPGCKRCCATAHEAPDAELQDDFNN